MTRTTTNRARTPSPAPTVAPSPPPTNPWLDAGIVLAIVITWLIGASWMIRGQPCLAYDSFRDMAYAENILGGRLWGDPALNDHPWWYPLGNPLLFAAIARATGRTMLELYSSSILWLNVLNPVLLYLLVRVVWKSRAAGLLAVGFVGLGSYWWLTHALAPMPSVQGVAFSLALLLLWHYALRRAWPWAAATGVLAGLSVWHHPMCGMVLICAIGFQGVLSALWRPRGDAQDVTPDRFGTLRRAAIACALALAAAGPTLWHVATLPRINPAPFLWFGPELHDLRYALHSHAPLMIPLGLVGLWRVLRTMPRAWWVVGYLAVGVAGQIMGYAGHDLKLGIPYVLPHEFQWHGQLAFAICAAAGAVWLAELVARRARDSGTQARLATAAGIAIVTLAPAWSHINVADYQLVRVDAGWANTLRVTRWMREHLPIDATVAVVPDAGYYMSGLTGRKVVALPLGHMNPASEAQRHYDDLRTMLTTTDPAVFGVLARRYRVGHLMPLPRPEEMAVARARYDAWTNLERVAPGSDSVLFYRVLAGPGS